jgi:hypothetical protein
MAATTSQGKTFTLFIVGLTVAAAGLAFAATGIGKVALGLGAIGVIAAFIGFLKIKPSEGMIPENKQPAVLKLAALALALGGWLIVLFGIHLSAGVGGRMTTTVIGLVISLCGVIGLLPIAANKNAIWKS